MISAINIEGYFPRDGVSPGMRRADILSPVAIQGPVKIDNIIR